MYALIYVDPETMLEEEYFSATETFVANYKIISTPVPVPKHCLGFSYIRSEDYELDHNFDVKEMKSKSDHTFKDKVRSFCENIVVIEEEWFTNMNLTYGATSPAALIKRAKYRLNQKMNLPRDTKRRIW